MAALFGFFSSRATRQAVGCWAVGYWAVALAVGRCAAATGAVSEAGPQPAELAGVTRPADQAAPLTSPLSDADRQWWAYQPIVDPPVPEVTDGGWCRNEIDKFLLARLARANLQPAAETDPRQLTRRVAFSLTGLPPTYFSSDRDTNQAEDYAAFVDALLADPAFGEHQARYWLDLVRYAESDGYKADHPRPHAHLYRDYVIKAFNSDKPYDQFILEQLAGDEIDPGNREAMIATMYLRHGIYEYNQRDIEMQWQEMLNDVTETTAEVFLAQGLKCARCHDHKFDPLLQRDFYRLQAFFAAYLPHDETPVADLKTRQAYLAQWAVWQSATEDLRRQLWELEMPVLLQHTSGEGFDKLDRELQELVRKRPSERSAYQQQIASLASRQFELHPEQLPEWLDAQTARRREELLKQLAAHDHLKPAVLPTQDFVGSDVGPQAPPTFLPDDTSEAPVEPGFPTVLDPAPAVIDAPPAALQSTGRRATLARWIASRDNPLTARVIVNRIWQQHFGRGLVEPASDFGRLGAPPSHPALLDWLASRLIEDGWRLKPLHRRIVTSAAYRQASQSRLEADCRRADPDNRLLWRQNVRRLSGEELHDAILTASGELDTAGRSIYLAVVRNQPQPLLSAFDMPDRIRSCSRRHQTTTPSQALLMTNGSWVRERAAAMAAGHRHEADQAFVQNGYTALFGREAEPAEMARALDFLQSYAAAQVGDLQVSKTGRRHTSLAAATSSREAARIAWVHVLLNSNELLYVD
jgi:hypothetical protein